MSKPTDDAAQHVDELLSAPDSLKMNQAELRKYHERKAREAAEKSQQEHRQAEARRAELRASGVEIGDDDPLPAPSVEDMIRDIKRVASDEKTNPLGHKLMQCSGKRYGKYGIYPMEFLDQEFGTWQHAMEVAGLRDTPADRVFRANRAKKSRHDHKSRYLERYVAPYVVDPSSIEFNDDGSYLMLSISDSHSQFLDPFVWFAYLSALRDLKPDGTLWNGDTLEGAEISRHPKIKGWTQPFQSELDFHREMARQVREDAGFTGDFFCTGGNHGVDRVASYLTQVAPALAGLRSMRIDELLGLHDYNVQLFQGGTVASPQGTEDHKPGFLLFDFYRIHHGVRLGANPSADELKDAGRSGQSGHVHRAGLSFGTNEINEAISWMCTPMACRDEAGRAYVKSTTTGWQRGIGVCRLFPDGSVHQYPAVVQKGNDGLERITIEGITYFRPDDMLDPEPQGLWLADQRLAS